MLKKDSKTDACVALLHLYFFDVKDDAIIIFILYLCVQSYDIKVK